MQDVKIFLQGHQNTFKQLNVGLIVKLNAQKTKFFRIAINADHVAICDDE